MRQKKPRIKNKSLLVVTAKTNKKVKYHTTETIVKKSLKANYSHVRYNNSPAKDRAFVMKRLKEELLKSKMKLTKEQSLLKLYQEGVLYVCSMLTLIQTNEGCEPQKQPEIVSTVQMEQII